MRVPTPSAMPTSEKPAITEMNPSSRRARRYRKATRRSRARDMALALASKQNHLTLRSERSERLEGWASGTACAANASRRPLKRPPQHEVVLLRHRSAEPRRDLVERHFLAHAGLAVLELGL